MLTISILLSLALVAEASVNLTSTGCADSSGLTSCLSKVSDKTSSCIQQANRDNSQVEYLACGCEDYIDNANCYAAFCWNRVWECEYQEYMVSYFETCPTAKLPVPYFPIPNGAPDACSCNVGKVYLGINNAILQMATCSNEASTGPDAGSNLQKMQGCTCCEISGALSSIVEICPNTDPKLIGLSQLGELQSVANTQFTSCGQYLETYDCISDLGFSLDGVSTYLKPNDPLQTGTATLSNGAGTVDAPASGAVFTYTNGADGVVFTITAAAFDAKSTGKSSSGSSGSSSGGSGGSGGGSGSSDSDSKKGSGSVLTMNISLLAITLVSALALF